MVATNQKTSGVENSFQNEPPGTSLEDSDHVYNSPTSTHLYNYSNSNKEYTELISKEDDILEKSSETSYSPADFEATAIDNNKLQLLKIQEQRSNRALYRTFIAVFILSLIILLQNLAGSLSCTGDSLTKCYPQYTLEIKDGSPEAKELLSSIREGLKMISYVAKDLSITLNDSSNLLANEINYIDIIDTFSDHNIYKFNFNGYCRFNKLTKLEVCSFCNGLDIFSSLIKDVGLQLGNVSKVNNPVELGESLVITYSQTLVSLNELYLKGIRKDPGFDDLNMDSLKMVHQIKFSQTFGYIMTLCSFTSIILSILMVVFLSNILLSFNYAGKFNNFLQLNIFKFLLILTTISFLHLVSNFMIVVSESIFYKLLLKFFSQIDIAKIKTSSGYNILVTNLILIVLLKILIIVIFSKKWTLK